MIDYDGHGCPVCGKPRGPHPRGGLLNTCGGGVCIDTYLHRQGQSHIPSSCLHCLTSANPGHTATVGQDGGIVMVAVTP